MNDMPRDRKCAVFDKKRSQINYIKSDSAKDINFTKRFNNTGEIDLNEILIEKSADDLPNPPVHSNKSKKYCIETKTKVNYIVRLDFLQSKRYYCRIIR